MKRNETATSNEKALPFKLKLSSFIISTVFYLTSTTTLFRVSTGKKIELAIKNPNTVKNMFLKMKKQYKGYFVVKNKLKNCLSFIYLGCKKWPKFGVNQIGGV